MLSKSLTMSTTWHGTEARWLLMLLIFMPMKSKLIKCKPVPYMNYQLHKVLHARHMTRNKLEKFGNAHTIFIAGWVCACMYVILSGRTKPGFVRTLPRTSVCLRECNLPTGTVTTVKPVCNDHLYNKICFLWFIRQCVLMKTGGINLLLITISAFWSSSRWSMATLMSSRRQRSIPIGGRYRQVSLYFATCRTIATHKQNSYDLWKN